MMRPKALIYCRVSTKGQETDGHGLESQETRCRQHAELRGYDVVAVFPDTMTGGGDFAKRAGMMALLAFMDERPDEDFIVIFDDLKRFARDRDFHFRLRDAFRARRATLECLNYQFDETPEGEYVETIFAAHGQLERKQNARQVRQKMRARMESGYWIHNPVVGYRYVRVPGRGRMLEPNPPFDAVIREAFEGFASGHFQTQAEVKRFFESVPDFPHLKNGKLTQQRVTDILTHPIYTGHICSEHYGIHWLKAQHEPLISLATYDKVQERRQGAARAPKRKNIGDHFALRGVAVCDGCQVPLRSSMPRGKLGKRYPYYLCQTKICDHYGKSIRRDQIEGDVGEIIKSLQPDPDMIEMLSDMFRMIWDGRRDQAKAILRKGKRQITQIDKEIDKLLELIMASGNTTAIKKYEDKIAEHEGTKARLIEKLANQSEPKSTFEEKLEPAIAFLSSPWKLWETPGPNQIHLRRLVLKLAFKSRLKYCRFEGARTPKIALPFKALERFSGPKLGYGAGEGT